MQVLAATRQQLDALLGEQLTRFLGEYTASAAESAATFLLSDDLASARRNARRTAAEKLLSKPIGELVQISDIEMALMRDAVWSAVQEFRLPHEAALVDRLYDEFGAQPFTILRPSSAVVARGDAPLFERGRSVLHSIIERFLDSEEWDEWAAGGDTPIAEAEHPAEPSRAKPSEAQRSQAKRSSSPGRAATMPSANGVSAVPSGGCGGGGDGGGGSGDGGKQRPPPAWDGWD